MPLDIDQMCKNAERWRFQKAVAGEMPLRDRAHGRAPDKQEVLDAFIRQHIEKYGILRLKNGDYVSLGCFSEEVAEHMRLTGEFPDTPAATNFSER